MATPAVQGTALLTALRSLRYELVPVSAIREVASHLPPGSRVTITSSPKMGIERTVRATEELSADGYRVTPHLAARQVENAGHLTGIVERLVRAGVDDVIVLAGDARAPAGDYASAMDLLRSLDLLGRPFTSIGISGYPEGHPTIAQIDLQQALLEKAEHATYIVTQMCFSPDAIRDWLAHTRTLGIALPVYLGIPGKVSQKRLLAMAARVGVGESLRFLRRNAGSVMRMLLAPEFDPEDLMTSFEPLLLDPSGANGFHVYTFNAVSATESWRRDFVQRLANLDREYAFPD
jgi:methylenetetrahydrofolate reductase (NADPH)